MHVIVWVRRGGNDIELSETWLGIPQADPTIPVADRPFCSLHFDDRTNFYRTNLRIVAGENGFHVGGNNLDLTNRNGSTYFFLVWD